MGRVSKMRLLFRVTVYLDSFPSLMCSFQSSSGCPGYGTTTLSLTGFLLGSSWDPSAPPQEGDTWSLRARASPWGCHPTTGHCMGWFPDLSLPAFLGPLCFSSQGGWDLSPSVNYRGLYWHHCAELVPSVSPPEALNVHRGLAGSQNWS